MLKGMVVIVSGAAGQIGSTFARSIVNNGGRVVLADIMEDKGRELAADLGENNSLFVRADVTLQEETDCLIQETISHFGQLDAAVHSAYPRSQGWGTRFEDLESKNLAEDLQRQLGGAILFSQRVLIQFRGQGYGNLVHVSSIHGVHAPKFEHYEGTSMVSPIEYSAIKAGIISVTRYLAKYYKGQNIRVNCISPGGIRDNQPESFLQRYRQSCNTKGMLDTNDLCGALMLLLSKESRYITGQNLIVDDGWSL